MKIYASFFWALCLINLTRIYAKRELIRKYSLVKKNCFWQDTRYERILLIFFLIFEKKFGFIRIKTYYLFGTQFDYLTFFLKLRGYINLFRCYVQDSNPISTTANNIDFRRSKQKLIDTQSESFPFL